MSCDNTKQNHVTFPNMASRVDIQHYETTHDSARPGVPRRRYKTISWQCRIKTIVYKH